MGHINLTLKKKGRGWGADVSSFSLALLYLQALSGPSQHSWVRLKGENTYFLLSTWRKVWLGQVANQILLGARTFLGGARTDVAIPSPFSTQGVMFTALPGNYIWSEWDYFSWQSTLDDWPTSHFSWLAPNWSPHTSCKADCQKHTEVISQLKVWSHRSSST